MDQSAISLQTLFPHLLTAVTFFLTTYLIGLALYRVTKQLLPEYLGEYVGDFFKTMLICAYPFGHGIVRREIGDIGFLCLLVLIMLPTLATIGGDGSPISVWIKFFRKKISVSKTIIKTVVMMTSGFVGFWFGLVILKLELQSVLFNLPKLPPLPTSCKSFLIIPGYQGFLLELVAVMYDSWFSAQKLSSNPLIDVVIKIVNTGTLVIAGFHLTGMFIHPPKAFGYSWGCPPTSHAVHMLVYWVAPFIGAWLSRHLQDRLRLEWSDPPRKTNKGGKPGTNKEKTS
ncbi:hypothetical protein ACF0H5_017998 [Mactra antiquata]